MKYNVLRTVSFLFLFISCSVAAPVEVAKYEFNNVLTSTDTHADSSAGSFDTGASQLGSYEASAGNPSPCRFTRGSSAANTEADSIAAGDYWEFTVTPTFGKGLRFYKFTFNAQAHTELIAAKPL